MCTFWRQFGVEAEEVIIHSATLTYTRYQAIVPKIALGPIAAMTRAASPTISLSKSLVCFCLKSEITLTSA